MPLKTRILDSNPPQDRSMANQERESDGGTEDSSPRRHAAKIVSVYEHANMFEFDKSLPSKGFAIRKCPTIDTSKLLEDYAWDITTNPRRQAIIEYQCSNPIIHWPLGFSLWWESTSGKTWSNAPTQALHGAEGNGNRPDGGYVCNDWDETRAGSLLSAYEISGVNWFIQYAPRFDRSRGGNDVYVNERADVFLDFCINDRFTPQDYHDNLGFMNHRVRIHRI